MICSIDDSCEWLAPESHSYPLKQIFRGHPWLPFSDTHAFQ